MGLIRPSKGLEWSWNCVNCYVYVMYSLSNFHQNDSRVCDLFLGQIRGKKGFHQSCLLRCQKLKQRLFTFPEKAKIFVKFLHAKMKFGFLRESKSALCKIILIFNFCGNSFVGWSTIYIDLFQIVFSYLQNIELGISKASGNETSPSS